MINTHICLILMFYHYVLGGGKGCRRHHPFGGKKLLPVSDSENSEKINN